MFLRSIGLFHRHAEDVGVVSGVEYDDGGSFALLQVRWPHETTVLNARNLVPRKSVAREARQVEDAGVPGVGASTRNPFGRI